MEIKLIGDKFRIYESNNVYFLNFGEIKSGEKQVVELEIKGINTKNFELITTCGCTETEKKVINEDTVREIITFNGTSLPKTLIIKNNNKQTNLKLIGNLI